MKWESMTMVVIGNIMSVREKMHWLKGIESQQSASNFFVNELFNCIIFFVLINWICELDECKGCPR